MSERAYRQTFDFFSGRGNFAAPREFWGARGELRRWGFDLYFPRFPVPQQPSLGDDQSASFRQVLQAVGSLLLGEQGRDGSANMYSAAALRAGEL